MSDHTFTNTDTSTTIESQTAQAIEGWSGSANPTTVHQYIWLGVAVPKDLYDRVLHQVELRLKGLKCGVSYTAKSLCGDEFWKQLNRGDRNKTGICISGMTEHGKLPLILTGQTGAHAKQYQLK